MTSTAEGATETALSALPLSLPFEYVRVPTCVVMPEAYCVLGGARVSHFATLSDLVPVRLIRELCDQTWVLDGRDIT